jgi:methionyl-tRNA synthetase
MQFCGKDNLRQQTAMWQSMLLAAGLPTSQTIVIDGFITGEGGIKMSKSLGNVIDPMEIVKDYGAEALRYYVTRELSPFEDSPFTVEKFKESYNAALANGIGNLVSRVMKMASSNLEKPVAVVEPKIPPTYVAALDAYNIQDAMNIVWTEIAEADKIIQKSEPFKLIKTDKPAAEKIISDLCVRVYNIAFMLEPVMPETSAMIKSLVKENKMPDKPLFLRK